MLGLTPTTTPQDAQGALAVLQAVSDPKTFQARLKELQEQAQSANESMEEVRGNLANMQAKETELAKREANLAQAQAQLAKDQSALSSAQAKLADDKRVFSAALSRFEAERSQFDTERKAAEEDMANREKVAGDFYNAAEKKQREADALVSEYGTKLAQLKEIINAPAH